MFKYELGYKAKDKVTGFKGIIMARIEYIFGCNQYAIAPPISKDGSIKNWEWLDEGRLIIYNKVIDKKNVVSDKPGGIQSNNPTLR